MQGRFEVEQKTFIKTEAIAKTMPDYVQEWYLSLKASQKTAATCKDYLTKIRHFLSFVDKDIKTVPVNSLSPKVVEYFISAQTKEAGNGTLAQTSDSYQQSIWCCLNSFFSFLVQKKYINENPMTTIQKPKNRDLQRINQHRDLVNKQNCKEILEAVSEGVGSRKAKGYQKTTRNRDDAILKLLMSTGMRKTALSEINIEDIDFKTRILSVVDKGNKTHQYYLPDTIVDTLRRWLKDREQIVGRTGGALFVSSKGSRLSSDAIYDLVKKYSGGVLEKSISPHKLRAGFCSILYAETGDIEFVRRAVGHSNLSTTQRYIVTNGEEKKKAANMISNLFT